MKTLPLHIEVPDGYVLCPYPKAWIRENSRLSFSIPRKPDRSQPTIDDVLPSLATHGALQDWATTYSSVKGSTEFIFGLKNDKYYVDPHHNTGDMNDHVSIEASNVRLYALLPKRRDSVR